MKSVIVCILINLLFALPCFAQDLQVKWVQGKEAGIIDKKTGQESRVKEGDALGDGWKVIEVTDTLVTIEKQIGPYEKIRGQMPVTNTSK